MRLSKLLPAGAALLLSVATGAAVAADLAVKISGVAHERGKIRICLYNDPTGFRHEEKSVYIIEQPAAPVTVTARFENLPAGRYALIAYHDENGDGALNRLLGMIPSEGYGVSNNPKVMGPPKFEEAAIQLDESMAVEIKLNY
jgi:uncharacterized protein (DUF2141 family)